jgi:hypothetical protein
MRNQVPWLALLVFTADELTLSATQLNGDGGLFRNASLGPGITQSQTGTINVKVADVPKILSTVSPITALEPEPSDDMSTDLIFVPAALFSELCTSYDGNGTPTAQTGPDVSRYKYLAHVRDINTTGMADAGVEDNGVFGIVVSHRTGPLSNPQPQPVVAHLVSIEGVESDYMNGKWPIDPSQTPYVALSSLHSWTFITLPEKSFNIVTTFQNLGRGANLLRAPDSVISAVDASTPMGGRLKSRLEDGYTLTRYRTATGEDSAAIYRGPFTPAPVPYPLMPGHQGQQGSTWLSNSGVDLQIMDPEVGIMDLTYAVAWQLGKTLAVADRVFTTALGKLRTSIYNETMNNAKAEILRGRGAYKTWDETVASLATTIPKLKALHRDSGDGGLYGPGGSMGDRWNRARSDPLDLSNHGCLIQDIFGRHANAVGRNLMLSSDGGGTERYDEHNTPASTDWMVVLTWVLDKLFLYSVPAHYLIVDPTYLAPETLRFFHVDRNWTDALIDGALSLGNNLYGVDVVRKAIHGMISEYLYPSTPVTPAPQFPLFGFLMRSEAVTQYPDLKVSIGLKGVSDTAPILRHENLDVAGGVMLCLLDQVPGEPGLQSITFTQPPHQQSFIAGAELDSQNIQTLYKRIFTLQDQKPNPTSWESHVWTRQAPAAACAVANESGVPHSAAVFKWGAQEIPEVRTLLPTAWVKDVNDVLNYYGADSADPSKSVYRDAVPNAALAGLQLNTPIYQLVIGKAAQTSDVSQGSAAVYPFPSFPTRPTTAPSPPRRPSPAEESAALPGMDETEFVHRTKPHPSKQSTRKLEHTQATGSGLHRGPGHGVPLLPPPHSRPSRAPGIGPIFGQPPEDGKSQGPAGAPQYFISCVPIDNDPSQPGIPSGTGIPKDLVFKVVQDPSSVTTRSNYFLESFTVVFQLAGLDPSRLNSCLLDNYTGPGPFMLSNVRFNVLAQPDNDPTHGTCLALRVLPRSTKGSAPPDMCKEMSFIMPVCRVLKHNPGRIPVWVTFKYVSFEAVTSLNYDVLIIAQN